VPDSGKIPAYLLLAVTVLGLASGFAFHFVGGTAQDGAFAEGLALGLITLSFGTVGVFLLHSAPKNVIGWIFVSAGALGGISFAAKPYFEAALVSDWPGIGYAVWVAQAFYQPWILAMVALPLLVFPTGKVPSPRWRWLWWYVLIFAGITVVVTTLIPSFTDEIDRRDPSMIDTQYLVFDEQQQVVGIEVQSVFGIAELDEPDESRLATAFLPMIALAYLGPVAAMVYRFRRSTGVERLQIKWVAYSATLAGAGLCIFYLVDFAVPTPPSFMMVFVVIALLGVLGIPITAGIAVTRYRLYDIDRLISRTFTYAILAGLLGGVFATGVFLLGSLPFEGGVPVAASTLAVAALFNPVRRRIQKRIDRRFARTDYDPEQIIDDFTRATESDVRTEVLADNLLQTVEDTLKPDGAAIWIRRKET
jgi:hypothetical protein